MSNQSNVIPTYILYAEHEKARQSQLALLQTQLPALTIVAPIFPNFQKIPFLQKLIQKAASRTGRPLLTNEIGVILSHRKIWRKIKEEGVPGKHYLIVESDSKIENIAIIEENFSKVEKDYDLFFWGAWNNHVSIKKSTTIKLNDAYTIGEPMIRSVYGAYGYSINTKTANYLLQHLKKAAHPVDLYKHYVNPSELKIGAIKPEIIGTWQTTDSTIRKESLLDKFNRNLRIKIFSLRNEILAYFC